jgi:hypothetical protein
MRQRLEASASANGRSLTQELEARIVQTFEQGDALVKRFGSAENVRLVMTLGDAINLVETVAGRKLVEDGETLEIARDAVSKVMGLVRSTRAASTAKERPASKAEVLLSIGARQAVAELAAALPIMATKHSPEQIEAVAKAMISAANQALLTNRSEAELADMPEPSSQEAEGKEPRDNSLVA